MAPAKIWTEGVGGILLITYMLYTYMYACQEIQIQIKIINMRIKCLKLVYCIIVMFW